MNLYLFFPLPILILLLWSRSWCKQSKKNLERIGKWILLLFPSFYSSHIWWTRRKKLSLSLSLSLGACRKCYRRPMQLRNDAFAYSSISSVLKHFEKEETVPLQVAPSLEHIIKKIQGHFLPKWDYSIHAIL